MSCILIKSASDCSVNKFMACRFENNLEVLIVSGTPLGQELFEAWENIHDTYLDLSGTPIPELTILKQIAKLQSRNEAVHTYLNLTVQCIQMLGEPFPEILERDLHGSLKQNGINLTWRNDVEDFSNQLRQAQANETRFATALKAKEKDLADLRDKQKDSSFNQSHNSRADFIRFLNNLQRPPFSYRLDKDTTSVEELAMMARDYFKYLEESAKRQPA